MHPVLECVILSTTGFGPNPLMSGMPALPIALASKVTRSSEIFWTCPTPFRPSAHARSMPFCGLFRTCLIFGQLSFVYVNTNVTSISMKLRKGDCYEAILVIGYTWHHFFQAVFFCSPDVSGLPAGSYISARE